MNIAEREEQGIDQSTGEVAIRIEK